jgi:DNA polymerase I-like protein with 3'-5' exonuclease and polymerase domains
MHNGLHDVPVLRAMGVEVGPYHDTQVLAYHEMIRTGCGVLEAESQNLGTLAYRECGMRLGELRDIPGVDFETQTIPYSEEVMRYAGEDAVATWRLFDVYKQRGLLEQQAYQIDMGQVPLIEQMIRTGIPFDADATLDYYMGVLDKLDTITGELRAKAARLGNHDFNPGSHPQVRELITKRIGLRIRKRTRGGLASTNEKALADHKAHPFVEAIQSRRELDKLRSTYLAPLLEELSQ